MSARTICNSCDYESDMPDEIISQMPQGTEVWYYNHCGKKSMRFK